MRHAKGAKWNSEIAGARLAPDCAAVHPGYACVLSYASARARPRLTCNAVFVAVVLRPIAGLPVACGRKAD